MVPIIIFVGNQFVYYNYNETSLRESVCARMCVCACVIGSNPNDFIFQKPLMLLTSIKPIKNVIWLIWIEIKMYRNHSTANNEAKETNLDVINAKRVKLQKRFHKLCKYTSIVSLKINWMDHFDWQHFIWDNEMVKLSYKMRTKNGNVLVKNEIASRELRWKLWKCHLFLYFIIIDGYKWMVDSGLKYANHTNERRKTKKKPTAIFVIISFDTMINRIENSWFKKARSYRRRKNTTDLTYSKSVCVPQRLNNEKKCQCYDKSEYLFNGCGQTLSTL